MRETVIHIKPAIDGAFAAQLDDVARQLRELVGVYAPNRLLWTRIFFSDIANQKPMLEGHALYADFISHGAVFTIQQPPLSGSKLELMLSFSQSPIERSGTPSQCIVKQGGTRYLYHSVRLTPEQAKRIGPREQTRLAFQCHIDWLAENGLNLRDHCLRTWLYVRDVDADYAEVVSGRNDVFATQGLTADTHYIASTGIAGQSNVAAAAVAIDFWSVDEGDARPHYEYLHALDHLNPTHEYGVAFERATAYHHASGTEFIISGTASIDHRGQCLNVGDVERQADRLFENIHHLLLDGGSALSQLAWMVVYLRDLTDAPLIARYMADRFPHTPYVITLAPVCRPLWLIEVEGVARSY